MDYFFVVGCPRSGTTMLQQALNRHSQIVIPPESAFFFLVGAPEHDQKTRLAQINTDLGINLSFPTAGIAKGQFRELFGEMAEKYLHKIGRWPSHFGEKTPQHQLRIAEILQIFPDAKIILIYRDGRDVALSLTKAPWPFYSDLQINFAVWLHYYRLQRQAMRAFPGRLYCVQYEKFVTEVESELRKILGFLGLLYEPQVALGWGNHEGILPQEMPWKAGALEPIKPSRVGLWRNELSPKVIGQLERWGKSALQTLGYPLVTEGKKRLPLTFFPILYAKILARMVRGPRSRIGREIWKQFVHLVRGFCPFWGNISG